MGGGRRAARSSPRTPPAVRVYLSPPTVLKAASRGCSGSVKAGVWTSRSGRDRPERCGRTAAISARLAGAGGLIINR